MGVIFERYPAAQWQVGDSETIYFPVISIAEAGGNRIVPHERPGRDGAKLDDTGSKARQWQVTALFENSIEEPGIDLNSQALYPYTLRKLIDSLSTHETGTIVLPTVGRVRARISDYNRREHPDEDDAALLDLTVLEDNEDALDRAIFEPPSVSATVRRLAEQTVFSAQSSGVWSSDFADLREAAAEIETLMRAPGRAAGDVAAGARAHRRLLRDMAHVAEDQARSDGGAFIDPAGSQVARQLSELLDREAAAEDERFRSRPRVRPFVVDVERTSLFEIAARFDQDASQLLELNASRVGDPFALTRGQVVRIFVTA